MHWFFLAAILLINVIISWSNAAVAGRAWPMLGRSIGLKLLAWCGLVQSAIGFTITGAFAAGAMAAATHLLSMRAFHVMMELTYLLVILPALGSGFLITVSSWMEAVRRRDFNSITAASWNSFAMADNAWGLAEAGGPALRDVGSFFSSESEDDCGGAIVLMLVVLVLLAGVAITFGIWAASYRKARREAAWYRRHADPPARFMASGPSYRVGGRSSHV